MQRTKQVLSDIIFVDNNILVSVHENVNPRLTSLLAGRRIYHTETVKSEFDNYSVLRRLPANYKYIISGLSQERKDAAYKALVDRWNIKTTLTDNQIRYLRNDIHIIFEARYVAFSDDVD